MENKVNALSKEEQEMLNARLLDAIRDERIDDIKSLIKQGVDINARYDTLNSSVLHYAVLVGNVSVINLLLEEGIETEIRDAYGNTPLYLLLNMFRDTRFNSTKYIEMIKILFEKGAEFDAKEYFIMERHFGDTYYMDQYNIFSMCKYKIIFIIHTNHFINNNQSLKNLGIYDILLEDKECNIYLNKKGKFELPLDCTLEQYTNFMNYIVDYSVLSDDFKSQNYFNDLKEVFDSLLFISKNSDQIVQSLRNSNHSMTTFLLDYHETVAFKKLGERIVRNKELSSDFYKYFTCNKDENARNEKFVELVIRILDAIDRGNYKSTKLTDIRKEMSDFVEFSPVSHSIKFYDIGKKIKEVQKD